MTDVATRAGVSAQTVSRVIGRPELVAEETRLRVQRLGDPILRERAHDLDDLARRLIRHLTGDGTAATALPKNSVLVARAMGPAELLDYTRDSVAGLVLTGLLTAALMWLAFYSSRKGYDEPARVRVRARDPKDPPRP